MSAQSAMSPSLSFWRFTGWGPFSLRWQGFLDGWRGIPRVPPEEGVTLSTAQLGLLEAAARHDFHLARQHRDQQITVLRARRAQLDVELPFLAATLQALQDLEDQAALDPRQSDRRRAGEARLDLDVVRRRRRRELEVECSERQGRLKVALSQANNARAELDAVPATIEEAHEEYLNRLGMIDEQAREYMALYWRSLIRHHPQRDRLATRFSLLPRPLANWLQEQGGRA